MRRLLAGALNALLALIVFAVASVTFAGMLAAAICLVRGWSAAAFVSTTFYITAVFFMPVFVLALVWAPWSGRRDG